MPIEINPTWKLADPAWAVLFGVLLISIVAMSGYFPARGWNQTKRNKYMRTLALVSEILVSVGIIGIITFAARLKIDAEIRQADKNGQELHRLVNVAIFEFAKAHCFGHLNHSSSLIDSDSIKSACGLWPQLIKGPDEFVDWWAAKDTFVELASIKDISPNLAGQYAVIGGQIDSLIKFDNEAALNKHKKMLLDSDISWILVAVAVFLAIVGVGLKWARAALDFTRVD